MKYSLVVFLTASPLFARCYSFQEYPFRNRVVEIWEQYEKTFGRVAFSRSDDLNRIRFCVGREYFFQIPGGSKMASVYDRKENTIFLRKSRENALKHELMHVYLERKKGHLPYSLSEKWIQLLEPYLENPKKWKCHCGKKDCQLMNDSVGSVIPADLCSP